VGCPFGARSDIILFHERSRDGAAFTIRQDWLEEGDPSQDREEQDDVGPARDGSTVDGS
jgi:hypothetical protein